VARAVQPKDMEGIGEPIKAQAPRDRDDVPTIDEPSPEPAFALDMLIEMNARGVLEQPRGELMLGLLDGLAVDMIDLVADLIIAPALGRTGERIIVGAELQPRQRMTEPRG